MNYTSDMGVINLRVIDKDIYEKVNPILQGLKEHEDIDKYEVYLFGDLVTGTLDSLPQILLLRKDSDLNYEEEIKNNLEIGDFLDENYGLVELELTLFNKNDFEVGVDNESFEESEISKNILRIR